MPARSNEFQKLVTLIQRTFAPRGAKVTESAIVEVSGLEGGREIDVLIEGQFGPFELKIAVEAKDKGRKMDLTKFESIVGKYTGDGRVKVNKVVVVSHRGFYKNVQRRAKQLDVELITLAEATETDWAGFAPKQIAFSFAPHLCSVGFEPSVDITNKTDLLDRAHIFCTHGKDHGTVRQHAYHVIQSHVLPSKPDLLDQLCREATKHERGAIATVTWRLSHHFVRFGDADRKVTSIIIQLHAVNSVGPMECTEIELSSSETGKRTIQRARATVGGKKLEFLFPDGLKSKQITLNIDDAKSMQTNETKKRATKKNKKKTPKRKS